MVYISTRPVNFAVPQAPGDPVPIAFEDVYEAPDGLPLCQVAGLRKEEQTSLFFTTASQEPEQAVHRLDLPNGPPVPEPLPFDLWYDVAKWKAKALAPFFFAESNQAGWVYVASCADNAGAGLWARDPDAQPGQQWSRRTFLTGGGKLSEPLGQVCVIKEIATATKKPKRDELVAKLNQDRPLQLALGYRRMQEQEGGPTDGAGTKAAIRYENANASSENFLFPAPESIGGEPTGPFRWFFYEVSDGVQLVKGTWGNSLDLKIIFDFAALRGDAWCTVVARWKPESEPFPLESPTEWHSMESAVPVEPSFFGTPASVVHFSPNQPLPPGGAPNMHRGETWRGTDVNEGDAFDAIAVAADPDGGGAHRIALARQSSELYYSDDNGATFYPLGSEDAGTQQVGAAEEASLAEALRWRTTGLESMSVHGFYQLPSPGPREPGRLFTFANDGGVFFSDDNGETWVWAQTNVSSRRLVPDPAKPDGPGLGGDVTNIVDVTAMAGRWVGTHMELLLATTNVDHRNNGGRVVLSTDGGWTFSGRALCGLPEGAIWSLAEASTNGTGPIYAGVKGWGVYMLPPGSYEWAATGAFSQNLGAAGPGSVKVRVPTGTFIEIDEDSKDQLECTWLDPQPLVVIRDRQGVPTWLVTALVSSSANRVFDRASAAQTDTASVAGLYRLKLGSAGMPQSGASWERLSGLDVPDSFPYTWRFVTGLAADGQGGLAVSTQSVMRGLTWFEGAVLHCGDIGAPAPVFRLVMAHPAARGVAMRNGRLFVALGRYGRVSFLAAAAAGHGVPPWMTQSAQVPLATTYHPDDLYFELDGPVGGPKGPFTKPKAPIGVFEVRSSKGAFLPAARGLLTRTEVQGKLASTGKSTVEAALESLQMNGYLDSQLSLQDLTDSQLRNRNLSKLVSLQLLGDSLYLGTFGSGGWRSRVG